MNSAIERLLGLRVGDIMNRDVVLISAAASMEEAARTLADHDITGAPVVDAAGQCIGVLSVTDFAMRARRTNFARTSVISRNALASGSRGITRNRELALGG